MIKYLFEWVIIIIVGALAGATVGLFFMGFLWYGFPKDVLIHNNNSPEWIRNISAAILGVSVMLGVGWSVYQAKNTGSE